jgi:hypothetical protein
MTNTHILKEGFFVKKFKKVLALSLALAMGLSLAACGDSTTSDSSNNGNDDANVDTDADSSEDGNSSVEGNGDTFYIYVWNNEFRDLMANYMPGYTADEDHYGGYMDDGTRIQFVENENANMNYQNKLDEALTDGSQVDMFLVEADYAVKYTSSSAGVAMDIKDLGFTDDDINNFYDYVNEVVTDDTGVTRGVSWQAAPGFLVYNKDIAEEVLGVSDAADVQEYVKDWDAYEETAAKMAAAGYTMTTDYQEGSRVFNAARSTAWVQDGVITIPAEIDEWTDMAKGWYDNGYMAGGDCWDGSGNWGNGMRENNFCYFGCTWYLLWSMDEQMDGNSTWSVCQGPDSYYWGGTWLCAGANCTNTDLAYQIMYEMTSDPDVVSAIAKGDLNFASNKAIMADVAAENVDVGRDWLDLGDSNYFAMCKDMADAIEVKNMTPYDQMIESYQSAIAEYFNGTVSKDEAISNFYKTVTEQWPSLSAPTE